MGRAELFLPKAPFLSRKTRIAIKQDGFEIVVNCSQFILTRTHPFHHFLLLLLLLAVPFSKDSAYTGRLRNNGPVTAGGEIGESFNAPHRRQEKEKGSSFSSSASTPWHTLMNGSSWQPWSLAVRDLCPKRSRYCWETVHPRVC